MDAIIVVDKLLQEGLVLLQHLITHVGDVVEESLIFHLTHRREIQDRGNALLFLLERGSCPAIDAHLIP